MKENIYVPQQKKNKSTMIRITGDHDLKLIMLAELIKVASKDNFCETSSTIVAIKGNALIFDRIGGLFRDASIDESIQQLVPFHLQQKCFNR